MDIYSAFGAIDRSVLQVVKSLISLEPVKEEEQVDMIRVTESPLVLTKDIMVTGKVVTAHNLHQYKNNFYKLKVTENIECLLDDLLEIDE